MIAVDCPDCDSWHTGDERCLFDCCTCCGGEYPYGPSVSALCGTCAEGERLAVEENAREAVTVPVFLSSADSRWAEVPF